MDSRQDTAKVYAVKVERSWVPSRSRKAGELEGWSEEQKEPQINVDRQAGCWTIGHTEDF